MSVRRLAPEQPESFAFAPAFAEKAEWWIGKFPEGRQASAVIPLLWLAQKQEGWISEPAMRVIAERLEMPYIRVYEVATFYTMFNLAPVGEHLIQVCGTTPCWLRGADDLKAVCETRIGPRGKVSEDGKFSWMEVECLGACANAPMVQISNADGDLYYEDLDGAALERILDQLAAGETPDAGPVSGRKASEPTAATVAVLKDESLFDGSRAKTVTLPNAAPAKAETPAKPAAEAKGEPPAAVKPAAKSAAKPAAKPAATGEAAGAAPDLLKAARDGKGDDLKKIKGLGPKLEERLNALGVFHYDQIAGWTAANARWVDGELKLNGRIERDDWIAQANTLQEGGE